MNSKKLAMVGGEAVRPIPLRPPPVPANLDPGSVLRAQEFVQLALGSLLEAQGYTGRATVGQLVDAWLEGCRVRCTETTTRGYRHNLQSWCRELGRLRAEGEPPQLVRDDVDVDDLERRGRAMPVAQLEPGLVERGIDGLAAGRWNSVTGTLRSCLRWANRHGFAGVGVLVPALRRHKPRPLTISPDAWAVAAHALYEAFEAARPRSRAAAAAALCSVRWGVRRGGVVGLEWRALDGAHVREDGGREILLVDKGRERIVVLDELDAEILASLPRRGPWVFGARKGSTTGHVHCNTITAHTRRVLRAAGVQLTLHQAGRHAAGRAILAYGGSVDDVVEHLGHASDRVTKERYLLGYGDTRRARAALQKALAGQKGKRAAT